MNDQSYVRTDCPSCKKSNVVLFWERDGDEVIIYRSLCINCEHDIWVTRNIERQETV